MLAERREENSVSTSDIFDKVLSLNPDFKSANRITLTNWVYRFIKRRVFSIRTRTRVSQITDAAMHPVRRDYCRRLMTSYRNRINDPRYLINMDETAVFLNCAPNRMVNVKGEKTVSVMIESSSSLRFTLAISVAVDSSKLPLFAIFKGKPGGSIEKKLPQIIPAGIVSCVQAKGWMDDRTMSIWYERVYKPHISTCDGESGLILDDFICHKSQVLKNKLEIDDFLLYLIPSHYTGLLQPCDVEINKSLKDRLKKKLLSGIGVTVHL